MAQLVAHEVEVAAVDGGEGHEAYHLVEGHAAGHVGVVVAHHHVPVHFRVDKAENHGLVAHERLVVALDIRDGLFVGAAVGELPEYRCGMPVLVLFLLEGLDPVVGDAHGHAVVKADAAVLERDSQAGHAAHLLGYGDSLRVHLVDKDVGEGQIYDGVLVLAAVVIVGIAAEGLSEAVVVVEHRGDAVEAETVEVVFLKPIFAVRQQEVEHLVLAVVEAERVPCRMLAAAGVGMEILVHGAVEASEAFVFVLDGMAVHDVHDHGDAAAVGVVDESFEVFGGAETA